MACGIREQVLIHTLSRSSLQEPAQTKKEKKVEEVKGK